MNWGQTSPREGGGGGHGGFHPLSGVLSHSPSPTWCPPSRRRLTGTPQTHPDLGLPPLLPGRRFPPHLAAARKAFQSHRSVLPSLRLPCPGLTASPLRDLSHLQQCLQPLLCIKSQPSTPSSRKPTWTTVGPQHTHLSSACVPSQTPRGWRAVRKGQCTGITLGHLKACPGPPFPYQEEKGPDPAPQAGALPS